MYKDAGNAGNGINRRKEFIVEIVSNPFFSGNYEELH